LTKYRFRESSQHPHGHCTSPSQPVAACMRPMTPVPAGCSPPVPASLSLRPYASAARGAGGLAATGAGTTGGARTRWKRPLLVLFTKATRNSCPGKERGIAVRERNGGLVAPWPPGCSGSSSGCWLRSRSPGRHAPVVGCDHCRSGQSGDSVEHVPIHPPNSCTPVRTPRDTFRDTERRDSSTG
jgi:hypothetical protein